jgi:riboflavin biosynthesis pyrimidine reductase
LAQTSRGQCIQEGLIDEIVIHLAPVLLGDGVRFSTVPAWRMGFASLPIAFTRKILAQLTLLH